MVASSTMDGESVILVRDYVNELLSWVEDELRYCHADEGYLRWMVNEKERIFVKEYENASLQYQNISRS